jgi:hemolysin III
LDRPHYNLFDVMHAIKQPHIETPAEETASSITHAIGGLLASSAFTLMVTFAVLAHDTRRVVAVSIYGSSLLLMYMASTCYHLVRSRRAKRTFRIIDHASIYLLIAGTYTPILLVSMRNAWGISMLSVAWGLAGIGVILKLFFVDRFEKLSVSIYVLMGWMVLIAARPLFAAMPTGGIVWLFAGGLAYTGGVVFFLWDQMPFNHAIWHLFVIAGSACHFFAIWLYVLPV